jgi:hypothetical protein
MVVFSHYNRTIGLTLAEAVNEIVGGKAGLDKSCSFKIYQWSWLAPPM